MPPNPNGAALPLIVHIIHHFGVGGMENGLVNLINHLPAGRYRHVIISLCAITDFSNRLRDKSVELIPLNRPEGLDPGLHWELWKLLRRLQPAIVHTRNLATLECQFAATLAGCKIRVHGEHGRDIFDIAGKSRKYKLLRKLFRPIISRYLAVSKDLQAWLIQEIGVKPPRVTQIYNGVDNANFFPRSGARTSIGPTGFMDEHSLIVGSVGRMAGIKNYPALAKAFVQLIQSDPALAKRLRLLIVGDGPARHECLVILKNAGYEDLAWLPGTRADIPQLMRAMDVFVMPSLGEGISNTILEAMACGLPVIATRVGGNPELVIDNSNGLLIAADDVAALTKALQFYCQQPSKISEHGSRGRQRIENEFSMSAMIQNYTQVYDALLGKSKLSADALVSSPGKS